MTQPLGSAADRCRAMDGGPDDPTWDELAAQIGIELSLPEPEDRGVDTEVLLNLHWPVVV